LGREENPAGWTGRERKKSLVEKVKELVSKSTKALVKRAAREKMQKGGK